jgi:serine/threonine-protein kinase
LDKIGKYKIVSKIGQGATSHVYKGKDETLGRFVAVKTIAAEVSKDETLRKRFRREAESAALLNHPNIITVYDFGEEQDKLYIAMELLEGVDLKQALAEGRLATLDQKLDVMYQICEGLAFAHSHGIFHRDLKPANLHVLANGKLKIMDFGLARLSGSDMTRTGLVMGTPHYMSPEQVRGEHVDARSDVFAMGCVFYEILTGKKPFDAESLHSVLYKVMQAEPPSAAEAVPGLPSVVVQVLERALAKRPSDRFQDAGEFRVVLESAREAIASGRGDEPLPGAQKPPSPPPGPGAPRSAVTQPIERVPSAVTADPPVSPSPASTSRRPDRPSSGSRSRSVPVPAPPAGPGPLLWIVGGGLLVVVAVAVVLFRGPSTAVSPSPPPTSGQISTLAKELADSEARNAGNKLAAGDYADAALRAERALKFDPENAEAKRVRDAARDFQKRIDAAAEGAKSAADEAQRGDSYWKLLELAPEHPAAAEVAPALDAGFKARADQARDLMSKAQQAAEKAQTSKTEQFGEGTKLASKAEASYRARAYARAAREYMLARDHFRRAQR